MSVLRVVIWIAVSLIVVVAAYLGYQKWQRNKLNGYTSKELQSELTQWWKNKYRSAIDEWLRNQMGYKTGQDFLNAAPLFQKVKSQFYFNKLYGDYMVDKGMTYDEAIAKETKWFVDRLPKANSLDWAKIDLAVVARDTYGLNIEDPYVKRILSKI